jgi:hypothetical protein
MLLNANCRAWHSSLSFSRSASQVSLLCRLHSYVKSPVASLCFVCSSVKNRVRVMMSVLTASPLLSPLPLDAILSALRLNAVPSSLLLELYVVDFEHNGEKDKDGVCSEEGK